MTELPEGKLTLSTADTSWLGIDDETFIICRIDSISSDLGKTPRMIIFEPTSSTKLFINNDQLKGEKLSLPLAIRNEVKSNSPIHKWIVIDTDKIRSVKNFTAAIEHIIY